MVSLRSTARSATGRVSVQPTPCSWRRTLSQAPLRHHPPALQCGDEDLPVLPTPNTRSRRQSAAPAPVLLTSSPFHGTVGIHGSPTETPSFGSDSGSAGGGRRTRHRHAARPLARASAFG